MKLGLIFLNDWELYGDGSGDYFEVQHKPLEDLQAILEDYNAKLTVMAEVGQQWAHQAVAENYTWASEVSQAWESILKDTVQRGHDVQLHFHPQWLGARYDGKNWRLRIDRLTTSSLSKAEFDRALQEGKRYLESLLKTVDPEYECFAFRAGAYCTEPSREFIASLLRAGLRCDTSVIKWVAHQHLYDYSDAYSNFIPWFVDPENIKHKGAASSGLLEMPIYSLLMTDFPVLRKILHFYYGTFISARERTWFAENRGIIERRYPTESRVLPLSPLRKFSPSNLLRIWVQRKAVRLDYDELPAKVFVKMIRRVFYHEEAKCGDDSDIIFPILALGHVKIMHNTDNVARILDGLNVELSDRVAYWTLREAENYWSERAG